MKKLLLSASLLLSFGVFSQTTLFQDDFAAGSGNWSMTGSGDNAWTVNNTYWGGGWVTDTPNQPGAISGSPQSSYMHIMSGLGCSLLSACNANFDTGSPSIQNAAMTTGVSTIGMTNVTVDFWYLCAGFTGNSYGNLEYSTDGGGSWITQSTYSGVATWTLESQTNAIWDNVADLRIRFKWQNGAAGNDPAFSVDDILIVGTSGGASATIATAGFTPASWCYGDIITGNLDFTATGTFNGPNVYTAQMSDAAGSFAAPTVIGTLPSSASGTLSIPVTILGTMPVGSAYRVRVIASDPSTTGTDNGTDLEIFALPTVTLSAYSNVCVGDPALTLGGGAPSGGTYSGTGVSGGMFTPSTAGVGTHTITYTYTNTNGCSNTAAQTITVDPCAAGTITTGAMAQMSWCYGTTLTDVLDFTATGTFNGPNVYSAEMSDGAGSFALPTVIGTLPSSASGSLTINIAIPGSMPAGTGYRIRVVASDPVTIGTDNGSDITIYDQPTVSLGAYTDVCIYTPIFTLTGGVPSGGNYSGPGIAAGSFDPAAAGLGTSQITYTVVDVNGCSNTAQQDIIVDACAGVNELDLANIQLYPNPAMESFSIVSDEPIEQAILTDMNGRIVKIFSDVSGELDVREVPEGLYLVQIQLDNTIQTVRLVIR
ncbi:MAG: T9SS type A sorting domain-containing protein [Crocinitomicaceae bacterium]|nr:T9SS type A sorting domain-containing protein [Crocinitomicaceae bacterium]